MNVSRCRLWLAAATIACASTVAAQNETARFLLPFTWKELHGAHGSVWETRTWVYNRGTAAASVIPAACLGPITCGGGLSMQPEDPPAPFVAATNVATGLLVHVEGRTGADIVFASRVRDRSRGADSAGTELPVVRENEFRADRVTLIDIPVAYGSRAMLRIYGLPEAPAPREVEVRYYRMLPVAEEKALLVRQRVRLQLPVIENVGARFLAAYGQVPTLELIPEFFFEEAFWIEVVPVSPELRIWAFVSVTNNVTQQVTLVTPMTP